MLPTLQFFHWMLRIIPVGVPEKPVRRDSWRDRVRADLAAQVEAGGTLYGFRKDGAYIARTKNGDRIIKPADRRFA